MKEWTISDDQKRRHSWTAISGGALTGAAAGLLVGLGLGGVVAVLSGLSLGAVTGGAMGKLMVSRIVPKDWEGPTNDDPSVGMHAPDTP